ncbi:MAG TPA: RNA polymerase alpha subunit C-terminal domain-containing protein [Bacteroidia bacterium]|nr:RNA polymerase alpha subunit C-terminal domain-containing protein [Bacteroidia bacterium]
MANAKTLRTCKNGHQYYKSTTCPTCPICEQQNKPTNGFLSLVSAPARRALEANGLTTLKQLSKYTEKQLLQLHGIGPSTIPVLKKALAAQKLAFK